MAGNTYYQRSIFKNIHISPELVLFGNMEHA